MPRADALAVLWAVLCAACGADHVSGRWAGAIDTLANGTVVVRNTGGGVWDSASTAQLTEDVRIGSQETEGPTSFNQVTALMVDGAGRVYVLERATQEIRVFDARGKYVRRIGRKGAGPAEFQDAIGMDWDRSGHLWVVDQRNARYSVFDTAGHLTAEHPRPFSTFFTSTWRGGIDSIGRVYEWYNIFGPSNRTVLLRLDSALHISDTLPLPNYEGHVFKIEHPGMRMFAAVPFTPSLVWSFDPRGYIWFGTTVPYRVYQRRFAGDTVRIIERSYSTIRVTAHDRDSAVASLKWFTDQGGIVNPSRIPDVKPAFAGFVVDDRGHLWVQPVTSGHVEEDGYDVFDVEGRYLGRMHSRIRFLLTPPPIFKGSYVYGVVSNEDGVPYIVRARVTRPEGR